MDKYFRYHPQILTDFPSVVGGVIIAEDLAAESTPSEFSSHYLAEQKKILGKHESLPLSQIPSIYDWRRAFRQFGTNPTKYRSAAEALLRRLTKKGSIPNINLLVDIANLVSIRYSLPVAVFDTRSIAPPLTVHYADGSELFTPLGSGRQEHPNVGEVVFSDRTKTAAARRWCWRQSAESAAGNMTNSAIITVEAQHEGGEVDVRKALEDLLGLLSEFAAASCSHAILRAISPA